jgi:hypothetical protein
MKHTLTFTFLAIAILLLASATLRILIPSKAETEAIRLVKVNSEGFDERSAEYIANSNRGTLQTIKIAGIDLLAKMHAYSLSRQNADLHKHRRHLTASFLLHGSLLFALLTLATFHHRPHTPAQA